jgi:HEAT repeat protein
MVHDPDFLSWYERWLDELLGGYETSWFGFGPGGGEDEFFQILDDSQSSDNVKAEAARAFSRLPRLSNVATSRIPKYLCHPAAGVRAEACATVGAFELRDAEEEVARLLEDPSSDVRREAVRTVMKLNPGRWTEAVLCRLREDSGENVVTSAFFSLKDQGALSKEELLRIVEHSPLGGLRSLAAHSVSWSAEDMDLLIHMLSDSQSQVRSRATLGLGQIKAHSAVPQLVNLLSRENDKHVISSTLKRLGELGNRNDYRLLVPILLEWAKSEDDFYRLDAIESLVKIGDERAIPIVKSMLLERRNPVRLGPHGLRQMSSVHTIRDLVRQSLKQSPSRALRRLAYGLPIYWWMWAILIPLGLLLGAYFAQGWHK